MEQKVLDRINKEIERIDKKENHIYFFVIDTKGTPSGSLEYIYKLAKFVKDDGYNVSMMYQVSDGEEFVGVGDWLGEEYASMEHLNVSDKNTEVSVSPSDILFIPEIFAQIMVQTKKMPCKRIAILQNFDYMVEQMPFSVQWGDLGVLDCITNTHYNKQLLLSVFPYVKTTVITPYIDKMFGTTSEPKKMIINIVAKNQTDINRIIKPFYWKHPSFKWVSFRDLRDLPKEKFAEALREAAVTIYVDEYASFGYTALEAIKSGNIVIAKSTENELPWAVSDGNYNDSVIWFDSFNEIDKMIASVVRSWITDKVPFKITDDGKKVLEQYSEERTKTEMLNYIHDIIQKRKEDISVLKNVEEN